MPSIFVESKSFLFSNKLIQGTLTLFQMTKFWTLSKHFVDNTTNVAEKLETVLRGVKNNMGKRENAGYQHFLLFPQCFQKVSFTGLLKVRIVW